MILYDSTLITPTTGLMIWTLVTFVVVLVVLRKYAFGPIQQMIDERREGDHGRPGRGREGPRGGPGGAGRVPPAAGRGPQGGLADRRGRPPGRRGAARGGRRRARGRDGSTEGAGQGGDRRPRRARRSPSSSSMSPSCTMVATEKVVRAKLDAGRAEASDRRGARRRRLRRARTPRASELVADRIEPAARVYAEALYAAARDAGRTREVDSDLEALIGGARPRTRPLSRRSPIPRSRARPRSASSRAARPTPTRSSGTPCSS